MNVINKIKDWLRVLSNRPLQVKAGKCYQARGGLVFGPLVQVSQTGYMFLDKSSGYTWREDGKHMRNCISAYDLVKELRTPPAPEAPWPQLKLSPGG